ncbi:hypothetical protein CVT26_015476 [Gymnopilus dilepis]|uniref:Uncharacterized protein n=1 Tax=Gymnopilus dilepis TaxID=231916 RepID=A0A409WA56_9AGAR|nr:hypothetical protein CVT26_015476 [Gymnopilus dilepis]
MDGRTVIRSAKLPKDWTSLDLLAYNITVSHQESVDFFGKEQSPIDRLNPLLLSNVDPASLTADSEVAKDRDIYRFHTYLRLASRPDINQKGALHDLERAILEVMGYEETGTILRSHYEVPFTICADYKAAEMDICLIDITTSMILAIFHERIDDELGLSGSRVIGSSIAAFQHNNERRIARGFEPLDSMIIPCITLVRSRPTFYKVPVTTHLSECVITGTYPAEGTVVVGCSPPTATSKVTDRMDLPSYRRIALQYYDAFRDTAKDLWNSFLQS